MMAILILFVSLGIVFLSAKKFDTDSIELVHHLLSFAESSIQVQAILVSYGLLIVLIPTLIIRLASRYKQILPQFAGYKSLGKHR